MFRYFDTLCCFCFFCPLYLSHYLDVAFPCLQHNKDGSLVLMWVLLLVFKWSALYGNRCLKMWRVLSTLALKSDGFSSMKQKQKGFFSSLWWPSGVDFGATRYSINKWWWMCSFISLWSGDFVAASRDELHIRKIKLNYQEVGQCSKDAQALWERKLTAPGRMTVPQDKEELYRALCQGERCVCV